MIRDGLPLKGSIEVYCNEKGRVSEKQVEKESIMEEINQLKQITEDRNILEELEIISQLLFLVEVIFLSRKEKYEIELYFEELDFGAKRAGKIITEHKELHNRISKMLNM